MYSYKLSELLSFVSADVSDIGVIQKVGSIFTVLKKQILEINQGDQRSSNYEVFMIFRKSSKNSATEMQLYQLSFSIALSPNSGQG